MLVLLLGPSGTGKTSIIQILDERYGWKVIPSFITRPTRELERYKYTLSDVDYRKLLDQNRFFSHVEQFQYMYGTLRDDVELAQRSSEPWLLDFDVLTYEKVFERIYHISFVILPASEEQLIRQLTAAGRLDRIESALEQMKLILEAARSGFLGLDGAIFITSMPNKIATAAAAIASAVDKATSRSKT